MGDGAAAVLVFEEALEEAIAAGKLYFVHRARFAGRTAAGTSAVTDCVQALIATFVREGAGLSIDAVADGYVVQLARRVVAGEILHEPVRRIVEWHGGVYGVAAGDLDLKLLTPPMPPGYGEGAVELRENVG